MHVQFAQSKLVSYVLILRVTLITNFKLQTVSGLIIHGPLYSDLFLSKKNFFYLKLDPVQYWYIVNWINVKFE